MSLRSNATMEAFINKIIRNEEIMKILDLPLIKDTDSQDLIDEKRCVLINKFITKTSQVPVDLNSTYDPIIIDGVTYENYWKIRITVSMAQSIKVNSDLFGRPQIDLHIYYDNTEDTDNVFKLLDLISDEFSGQNLDIITEKDKMFARNIKCEGQTSQTGIINNYERIGLRFSFFATLYKI